ncbi:MAG: ABC transporter substrate-binding protein [Verrucomicrobiota bacterium]
MRAGRSVYQLDRALIRELAPSIILAQGLCDVCAPGEGELSETLGWLSYRPQVITVSPHCLTDVWANLEQIGASTGRQAEAERLATGCRARLAHVAQQVRQTRERPRVFFMEWVDPIFCGGHWIPEMVQMAGGHDPLGRPGADSVRLSQEEVIAAAPEIMIGSPCGVATAAAASQMTKQLSDAGWAGVPAIDSNRVYAVDAARFSRPSLRLAEGVELLAHLFHPRTIPWRGANDAAAQVHLPR